MAEDGIMGIHKSECHGVYIPVKGSLLPSLVSPLEGFGGLGLSGFMGRLGESLSIRYFEVGLGLLVQDIQSSHGFDGRVDPFDEVSSTRSYCSRSKFLRRTCWGFEECILTMRVKI